MTGNDGTDPTTAGHVAAANTMTARWAATLAGDRDDVFCVPGAWTLLALLGGAAAGTARDELLAATGVTDGTAAHRSMVALLRDLPGTSAAVGMWFRDDLDVVPGFVEDAGPGTVGILRGAESQPVLDAWARETTGGLVDRMPVAVDDETRLLLASAVSVAFGWDDPFTVLRASRNGTGPWSGTGLPVLFRAVRGRGLARLVDGDLVVATVAGGPFDVHLLLGPPGSSAAGVLGRGLGWAAGTLTGDDAADLPDGGFVPGLTVATVDSTSETPTVSLSCPPFRVTAETDLLGPDLVDVVGLRAATAMFVDHFPGIAADEELAVGVAVQAATAEFGADGFTAAAVTAIGLRAGAAMPRFDKRAKAVEVTFDRPFGFLLVHRPTGLVLFAGWVEDPPPVGEEP